MILRPVLGVTAAVFVLVVLGAAAGCSDSEPTHDGPPPIVDAAPELGAPDLGLDADALEAGPDGPDGPLPDAACPDPGVAVASHVEVAPTAIAPGAQATVLYAPSGPLGGSASLTLHYGFDFWTRDLGGASALDEPMTLRSDGTFEATVAVHAGAELLDFVFFTESGGSKSWDNNAGGDYHRSIGGPLIGPYLTWRDNTGPAPGADRDPARSVTVSFKTDHACQGSVSYGTAAGALGQSASESGPAVQHHIHLTGLTPATRYHYRVTCVDPAASCQVPNPSPTYSFRSAPAAPAKVRFAVLADPQDSGAPQDRWQAIAAELTQPPYDDLAFVVIAGDLARDDAPALWWDFFRKGRPLLASTALLPAVGNHDTPSWVSNADSTTFDALFDLESTSGNDSYYGLSYGPVQLLVLNSETSQVAPADWQPGGAQYDWMAGKLAQSSPAWRFAAWHIPPYNAGVRHSGQGADTRGITALFPGQMDWVFGGHEHLYQRTHPIRYGGLDGSGQVISEVVASYGRGAGDGVGYIAAPTAGHHPPSDTFVSESDPVRALLAYPPASAISGGVVPQWVGFVIVTVDGKSIAVETHAAGEAQPRDALTYTKP